ncbi:MAG: hypothetical protein HN975_08665 [Anaerolineae bacterium]|jgi:hypothetical protein|nr:hypothetical protein [Anaerolineae bacterium]
MEDERNGDMSLKAALKSWVAKHTTIPDFSKEMNYTYQHSWNLVSNKAPVTDSVVGRFALTYGTEALNEWFSLAQALPAFCTQKKSE